MATRTPPVISSTFTNAKYPVGIIGPRNIGGGEPAGGSGMEKKWRKKSHATTLKIRPSKTPAITRAALSTGGRAKSKFLCAAFGL